MVWPVRPASAPFVAFCTEMKVLDTVTQHVVSELLALTGETTSKLRTWLAAQPGFLPVPSGRTDFHNAFKGLVAASMSREATRDCCLGSRPMKCRFRLRMARFRVRHAELRQETDRTYLIFMAYEPCTEFLAYVLYDGETEAGDAPLGIPIEALTELCRQLSACVGLPIQRLLLTNRFVLSQDGKLLSVRQAQVALSKALRAAATFSNPLIVQVHPDLPSDYPSSALPPGLMTTTLLQWCHRFMSVHNAHFAIPKLSVGRNTLRKLAGVDSSEPIAAVLGGASSYLGRWAACSHAIPLEDLVFQAKLLPLPTQLVLPK